MLNVLVTGGAGFIGSHVCERLLNEGAFVYSLDDLSTGQQENVSGFEAHPNYRFVRGDVTDPLPMLEVDEIWNLACPASPVHYQADPLRTLKTSVFGMFNVLELARQTGARVLHASTSEVYGDPEVHPQPETYRGSVNPVGPRACYDEGKRAAETICFDHRRMHGTDVRVARIFNTYGPRMDPADGRVVSNFVIAAITGRPLEIYGDGSQTRSFCYIDDLVEGLHRLVRAPQRVSGPFNLGNPVEFSVLDLATMVLRATGSASRLVHRPLPEDDPKQRRPVIEAVKRVLGWSPRMSLEEGLVPTIAYFRRRVAAPTPQAAAGLAD